MLSRRAFLASSAAVAVSVAAPLAVSAAPSQAAATTSVAPGPFGRGGLHLIVGPTGSGKTALVRDQVRDYLAQDLPRWAVVLEDFHEFDTPALHRRVEYGVAASDSRALVNGIRFGLRSNVDVIVTDVTWLPDPESVAMTVKGAECGYDMLTSLHASDPFEGLEVFRQRLDAALMPVLMDPRIVRSLTRVSLYRNTATGQTLRLTEVVHPDAELLRLLAAGQSRAARQHWVDHLGGVTLAMQEQQLAAQGVSVRRVA